MRIAGALAAQGEVGADHELGEIKFFDQGLDEVLGFDLGQLRGEGDGGHGVEAGGEEVVEAILEAGQVGNLHVGVDDLTGVGVEGDGGGGEVVGAGGLDHAAKEGAVAAVDAVEDADGEGGGAADGGATQFFSGQRGYQIIASILLASVQGPASVAPVSVTLVSATRQGHDPASLS